MSSGDEERAAEEAKEQREAKKAMEAAAAAAAAAAKEAKEAETGAAAEAQAKQKPVVPESVNGVLTHGCLAISELIETNGLEEPCPNMHIIALDESLTQSMMSEQEFSTAIEKGPILLQMNDEDVQVRFPTWWDSCVTALKSEKQGCLVTPPDGKLPAEFVALLNMGFCDVLLFFDCFPLISLGPGMI